MSLPAASFTAAGGTKVCNRPSCQKRFSDCSTKEQGSWTVFANNSVKSTDTIRYVCGECAEHYRKKTATHRRGVNHYDLEDDDRTGSLALTRSTEIHDNIAAGQKQRGRATVQAVGTPTVSTAVPKRGRGNKSRGYTEEHSHFDKEMVVHRQGASALGARAQLVSLKVILCYKKRVRQDVILTPIESDCAEGLTQINAHIGATELREKAYNALLPAWIAWSHGFNLSVSSLSLRHKKDFTKIIAETDAIWDFFYRKKGNAKSARFDPNYSLILALTIESSIDYSDALHHRLTQLGEPVNTTVTQPQPNPPSANSTSLESAPFTTVKTPQRSLSTPTSKPSSKRPRSESGALESLVSLRKRLRSNQEVDALASVAKKISIIPQDLNIAAALRDQGHATNDEIASLFKEKRFQNIKFYEIPRRDSIDYTTIQFSKLEFKDLPTVYGSLTVDLTISKKLTGAFKTSHEGQIEFGVTEDILPFEGNKVCVKQVYSREPSGGAIKRYVGRSEADFLWQECRCLDWAAILLQLTYDYIEEVCDVKGWPISFDIPELRFVRSMLAISNESKEKAFLIEEWIDTSNDRFRKYINNGMPASCVPSSAPKHVQERAEFLCFAQHVQWRKSGYRAFTSDYQGTTFTSSLRVQKKLKTCKGAGNLLTDPQVMTCPSLGDVFADGNITRAVPEFRVEHSCNKYCAYFNLSLNDDVIALQART